MSAIDFIRNSEVWKEGENPYERVKCKWCKKTYPRDAMATLEICEFCMEEYDEITREKAEQKLKDGEQNE